MARLIVWSFLFLLISRASTILDLHGVNIPGLSFRYDPSGNGGVLGGSPSYPTVESLDPWIKLNSTLFRYPVLWNYIQPHFEGDLNPIIMASLDSLINHITRAPGTKRYAIVDIHNFGRFNSVIVGQESRKPYNYDLGNLWVKIANHYKDNDQVMFGIMNEPHDLDIVQWGDTVQYVIDCIRNNASATRQYILVPGTDWQGLSSWIMHSESGIGKVRDPSEKLLFDVHKYFDGSGGYSGVCNSFDGSNFDDFTNAMKSLNARAVLTEFGGKANPDCKNTLNQMLSFLEANPNQFAGWAAWGAGLDTNDTLYLDPLSVNTTRKQESISIVRDVLAPHMKNKGCGVSIGIRLWLGIIFSFIGSWVINFA